MKRRIFAVGARPAETHPEEHRKHERIAKRIARSGLCSRRAAERLIGEGRVRLNGEPVESAALDVGSEDQVTVDGRLILSAPATRLFRYHKPKGLVTTHRDPQGRPTVFAALPRSLGRVISVGRLDLNSEGLLLLTNDGELARTLERSGWTRRYRARVHGRPDPARLACLAHGVTVGGTAYGPIQARLDKQGPTNAWLTISLMEGRNREVRRVLEHLGLQVSRLIRTGFGPFQLGALPQTQVAEVPAKVIAEQLGDATRKRGRAVANRRR